MNNLTNFLGKKLEAADMKRVKGAEGSAQSTLESNDGGGGTDPLCWIHTYGRDGQEFPSYGFMGTYAQANQHCVDLIVTSGTGVYRCKISCSHH